MPLTRIEEIGTKARLALWEMTEDVNDLPRPEGVDLSGIHSDSRLKERLVTYALLHAMTSRNDIIINHLPSGQPVVDGYKISLSHTRGWAAMILSEEAEAVGIDIEYYSDRVNKVAQRFIRPDEQSDSLAYRLINWSVKETVYKALSSEDLRFYEMKLDAFKASTGGSVKVTDLKVSKELNVSYVLNEAYVMTWTVL